MDLMVYLAGEIHSDWRKEIVDGARLLACRWNSWPL